MVKGAVPGAENGFVLIKDAVKKGAHPKAPYPAGMRKAARSVQHPPNNRLKQPQSVRVVL